jgi:hypothetical protein
MCKTWVLAMRQHDRKLLLQDGILARVRCQRDIPVWLD